MAILPLWLSGPNAFRSPSVASERALLALRVTGIVLTAALVVVAAVLASRRVGGAFVRPLSEGELFLLGAALACWGVVARFVLRRLVGVSKKRSTLLAAVEWIPAVALGAIAAAVSLQGSSAAALLWLWLAIVAESGWAAWSRGAARRSAHLRSSPSRELPSRKAPLGEPFEKPLDEEEELDPAVVQQWVRRSEGAGRETISGWFRLEIPAGERRAVAHLAFCPPFARLPSFSAEVIDGPAVAAEATQVLPFGARVETRLASSASRATRVTVEFVAWADDSNANPAIPAGDDENEFSSG